MKRILLILVAGLVALAPLPAQSRKVTKQAKEDARLVAKQLKDEGYKSLDKGKLEDTISEFLTIKYSDKSIFEVTGKATEKNLNDARAKARKDALAVYPAAEIADSFFVYRKAGKKYEVICYALIGGRSGVSNRAQSVREGTSSTAAFARADQERKEAQAEAKKAEKKARKEIQKAQEKAEREAEKARNKAEKAHQKAVDKANSKAKKAIEKADRERDKALQEIGNY